MCDQAAQYLLKRYAGFGANPVQNNRECDL